MKTLKEKIEVMQAALDGEEIEYMLGENDGWRSYDSGEPSWDWSCVDFRIKPKPLEFWVNVYDDGTGEHVVFDNKKAADDNEAESSHVVKTIKVREVTE